MKAFFDKAKEWLLPIVIGLLVLCACYSAFMYHSNTVLANTITAQEAEAKRLDGELTKAGKANADLAVENNRLKQSAGITDDVTNSVAQKSKELDSRYSEMQKQVSTKLKAIEAKYSAQEPTKESLDRKAIEISLERSKGVWLLYCLGEPQAKECVE